MDNLDIKGVNRSAFTMLILLLIASTVSVILGFVVFPHTQFMGVFVILLVIFLFMAIAISFFTD